MPKQKLAIILGTRPELIKLAPVIYHARRRPNDFEVLVVATGQHRELVAPLFDFFEIDPDYNLDVLTGATTPTEVAADILRGMQDVYAKETPDWVVVQGDTTTVAAAGLGAFYAGVKVAHVEAGLRTYDRRQPFPEEINRRVTSAIADLHLPPTTQARENLLKENIPDTRIVVTGNTVIDALFYTRKKIHDAPDRYAGHITTWVREHIQQDRFILMTGHRRENIGQGFMDICSAVVQLAKKYPDTHIVYPVHLNPKVRETVNTQLAHIDTVHLIEPLGYNEFVYLMDTCYLILTDSGGVQEEGPSLGKPVLVMRNTTERPEGVAAGTSILVGTDPETIVREVSRLLDDKNAYDAMATIRNPYGDGNASGKILDAIVDAEQTSR